MPLTVNNLIGFGAAASGATMPSYVTAGTGATNTASGTLSISYPSGIQADDIIICGAVGEDSAGTTIGDTTFLTVGMTNFTTLVGPDGSTGKWAGYVGYKRATGSESGSETLTMSSIGGTRAITGIMWLFRGCITTGDPTNALTSAQNASSSTWNQKSLTTTVDNCLACHVIAAAANSATAGNFTGETGGDFTETNIYSAANGTVQLQTAAMPSQGTISGGSVTASVAGTYGHTSFGLKPVPA